MNTNKSISHDDFTSSITRVTNPSELASSWRKLENSLAVPPSFFLTWSWIGPWAEITKNKTELYAYILEKENEIQSICFITICNATRLKGVIKIRQVQINEYQNDGCNMIIQYNGLLTKDGLHQTAWSLLIECLQEWNQRWDDILISSLTEEQLDYATKAGAKLTQIIEKEHFKWVVPLSPTYEQPEDIIVNFKSKSRRQLRQSIKAFSKKYNESIVASIAKTEDQVLEYFHAMEKLHTKRWIKSGKSGSYANPVWVQFHEQVIKNSYARKEPLIFEISCKNNALGYIYGYKHGKTAYMIQTGFADSENNNLRPGYISHLYAMISCAKMGIEQYDFLPDGNNSYKKFFAESGSNVVWLQLHPLRLKFLFEKILRALLAFIRKFKS